MEVLLSAVSPMQLMAGKLLGHMGVSLVAMSFYLGLGLVVLASFSLFGLLDLTLIFYLFVFFLIAFFTIGSLMMAVGRRRERHARSADADDAVDDGHDRCHGCCGCRSRAIPNSTLADVVSFVPPLNSFGMLLRLASTSPPPAWQVWLSIGIGVAGVFGALWFAAKVFRIGLLMFGKPPNFATLVRWVRAA